MDKFYIAIGTSRNCTKWENKKITWTQFIEKFKAPTRTPETVSEYLKMTRAQQSTVKDIGGFIGGYCNKGKRKIEYIRERNLICLDLDDAIMGLIPDIKYQSIIHTTHKHTPDNPRYRIIILLKESITKEEYEYLSRYLVKELGLTESTDQTTYQANRLMYWASCPVDGEYIFKEYENEPFDGKQVLRNNPNWKNEVINVTNKDLEFIQKQIKKKQQDPTTKKGVIAAFCKAYPIDECIEKFITNYEPTDQPDRYTWNEGSGVGGVLIFDGLYSYSFHSTDPCTMRLCNAYDLIRIHLFEGKEKETLTFCANQENVGTYLAQEEFAEDFKDWMTELDYSSNGTLKATINNYEIIIKNTQDLKFDDFKKQPLINGRPYKNVDDSIIISYIEKNYKIHNETKAKRAIEVVAFENSFHPIKDWLKKLPVWDGKKRLDNLLIDYFGAERNIFVQEAIRKTLVAAVKRIYEPGCEVQHVLVLRGSQDLGKSYLFKMLCPNEDWFSDSLTLADCTNTKTSGEHILGNWILEIPEMQGMRKSEVQAIRAFITRQIDKYRPAFGRVLEQYPRECIFVATTNEAYLQDTSGNRRYWTVMCHKRQQDNIEVEQIWAEALYLYEQGESLKLSPEALKLSKKAESENIETDDRTNFIQEFIERKLPKDWYSKSSYDRILWLTDDLSPESGEDMFNREHISTAEIWCELFNKDKSSLTRTQSNAIIKSFIALGWTEKSYVRDKNYGKIVAFKKPIN